MKREVGAIGVIIAITVVGGVAYFWPAGQEQKPVGLRQGQKPDSSDPMGVGGTSDNTSPVRVIYDTDISGDVDDAGAAAVLHALADYGEAEILAMMVSAGGDAEQWGGPCLDAINTYYGRPDIPIGVTHKSRTSDWSRYNHWVAEACPHDLLDGRNAPGAVELYRKILSGQPDNSVTIVSVGYLTNLGFLIDSDPNQYGYSSLSGQELVNQKVKEWVCMGGKIPSGTEYNFAGDGEMTQLAVDNWTSPVMFSPYGIGLDINTGSRLFTTPENNPVRIAYKYFNGIRDRHSWDLTAVLYAVRGLSDYWSAHTTGHMYADSTGWNEWRDSPDKDHGYLTKLMSNSELENILGDLLVKPPAGDNTPPSAPTGFSASVASSSQINLNWDNNTENDLTYYELYRSESSGFSISELSPIAFPSSSDYSDTGLSENTTYYYKVTAVSDGNESSPSSEVSAKTDASGGAGEEGWVEASRRENSRGEAGGVRPKEGCRWDWIANSNRERSGKRE